MSTAFAMATELVPINLLASGQCARVAGIFGAEDQVHRLREIGIRNGAEVEMVCPGTPCIVRLDGTKLCFRGDCATTVLVQT